MKDLSRLLEEPGADPLQVNLLRLARSEGPSSESRKRILAGLGMGVAAGTLSQTSGAAQGATSGAGSAVGSAALKWGVASVIAIGASVVAFVSLRAPATASLEPSSSPASAAPMATVAPAASPANAIQAAPVPVTRIEDLPTLQGEAPGEGRGAGAVTAPSLAEEVAAIKVAKSALAAGDAAGSLRELDSYRTHFPRGRLAQEATVVRIEALLKSGNAAAANATADRFLAANASSPYAARVHTLIGR